MNELFQIRYLKKVQNNFLYLHYPPFYLLLLIVGFKIKPHKYRL